MIKTLLTCASKAAAFLAIGLMATDAYAVSITAANAVEDISIGGVRTFVFRLTGSGNCATQRTFGGSSIDPTSTTTGLIFDITPSSALETINGGSAPVNNSDLVIRVEESSGSLDPVALIPQVGDGYVDNSAFQVAYGTSASTIRFSVALADVALPAEQGYCNKYGICTIDSDDTITAKRFKFGIVRKNETFSTSSSEDVSEAIDIVLAACPAGHTAALPFTTPTLSFSLVPGDERVRIVNTTTQPAADSKVPLVKVVAYGDTSSTVTTTGAQLKREFTEIGGGTYTVDGLANDQEYCFSLGYVNAAGLVTTDGNWTASLPSVQCVTPSQVAGFLDRSTCFIASAAYGDEWDGRLEILRQFRDQVLQQNALGRQFVRWYYSWSPDAARWLFKNPDYALFVRVALAPVVQGARLSLWLRNHLWALGVLLVLGTGLLLARRLRAEEGGVNAK